MRMAQQMFEFAPDLLFPSPAFAIAFRAAMAALTLVQSDIVFAALDFLRDVLTHECLDPPPVPPPRYPVYAAAIRPVIVEQGLELTGLLLSGTVGDFPIVRPSRPSAVAQPRPELRAPAVLSCAAAIATF